MSYNQPAKQPKANGFMLFAKDFKRKFNLNVANNDLATIASPHWEKLTREEQDKYKNKANGVSSEPRNEKFVNSELPAENFRIEEEVMNSEVNRYIRHASELNELHSQTFLMIESSIFFKTSSFVYPAEFAITAFSLEEGLIDAYSTSINPGIIPYDVNSVMDKTVKYAIPTSNEHRSDYKEICQHIMEFVNKYSGNLIFFCNGNFEEDLNKYRTNAAVLKKIFEEAGEHSLASQLNIYPHYMLLFNLRTYTIMQKELPDYDNLFPGIRDAYELAKSEQNKYMFDNRDLACDYHESIDASCFCCLSKTRQYCFTIILFSADPTRYEIKAGKHFPKGFRVKA